MKDIHSIHNQKFEYDERRLRVNELEMMIADLRRTASDLEHQIKVEQKASGVSDINHFAYPTFARAAMIRRDNLKASISQLEKRLEHARQEVFEAMEQMKLAEGAGDLEPQRQVRAPGRRRNQKHAGPVQADRH